MKSGSLNLLEPLRPVQACNGIATVCAWRKARKISVSVVLILAEIRLTVLGASTCTVTEGKLDMYELDLHPVLKVCSYHV
jgi:hypothetical protein